MAAADQKLSARELAELTGGKVTSVNQVARMIQWLTGVLPTDGRDMLVKRTEEIDLDTGEVTKPGKDALTRDRVVRLLAYLEAQETLTEPLRVALRLLQIRLYGGSKTPAKFSKMLSQHVDGVIRGQYTFNGASQTGRFSAKGVQIHNLMRDAFTHEIDAIDALVAGIAPDDFAVLGDDTPISRKLSLLIRPTMVAQKGNAFVWGDWSNIEARITPWLALDPDAEEQLGICDVDTGVEPYDIYTRTTAALSAPLDAIDSRSPARQGRRTGLRLRRQHQRAAEHGRATASIWKRRRRKLSSAGAARTSGRCASGGGTTASAVSACGCAQQRDRRGRTFCRPARRRIFLNYLGGSLLCGCRAAAS
jgi:hypothetical protein